MACKQSILDISYYYNNGNSEGLSGSIPQKNEHIDNIPRHRKILSRFYHLLIKGMFNLQRDLPMMLKYL